MLLTVERDRLLRLCACSSDDERVLVPVERWRCAVTQTAVSTRSRLCRLRSAQSRLIQCRPTHASAVLRHVAHVCQPLLLLRRYKCFLFIHQQQCQFSALTLPVGRQEEHPACKSWLIWCWCGYLSEARYRLFAYTPWVKKTRHLTLAHNFTKYWPIFKIL